jgi:hypothetical protein
MYEVIAQEFGIWFSAPMLVIHPQLFLGWARSHRWGNLRERFTR